VAGAELKINKEELMVKFACHSSKPSADKMALTRPRNTAGPPGFRQILRQGWNGGTRYLASKVRTKTKIERIIKERDLYIREDKKRR
jgi:hypothetical protein